jgi:hypothetical protein
LKKERGNIPDTPANPILQHFIKQAKGYLSKGCFGKLEAANSDLGYAIGPKKVLQIHEMNSVKKRCEELQKAMHYTSKYLASTAAILAREDTKYSLYDFEDQRLLRNEDSFYNGTIKETARLEMEGAVVTINSIASKIIDSNPERNLLQFPFLSSMSDDFRKQAKVTEVDSIPHELIDVIFDMNSYLDRDEQTLLKASVASSGLTNQHRPQEEMAGPDPDNENGGGDQGNTAIAENGSTNLV